MRSALGLCVFLVACGSDSDMLPVGGGSGGGLPDSGPGGTVDGHLIDAKVIDASPAAVDAAIFNGRVCLLADPRQPTNCASTGAGGFTVRLGSNTAVSAADGTFKITAGTGIWSVTGSTIVTSYKVKADYLIPVITTATYDQMLTDNGVNKIQGEGSLIINVIRNGAGYAGATATSQQPNPSRFLAFYDGTSGTQWRHDLAGCGSFGMVWFPGIDVGDTSTAISAPGGTPTLTDSGQPISDGSITWSDVIFNQ